MDAPFSQRRATFGGLAILFLLLAVLVAQPLRAAEAMPQSALFVATSNVPSGKFDVLKKIAADHDIRVQMRYLHELPVEADSSIFDDHDIVLVDSYLQEKVRARIGEALATTDRPVAWLYDKEPDGHGVPAPLLKRLASYYSNGGRDNFEHLFATIHAWLGDQPVDKIPDPVVMPEVGIYHPDATRRFADTEAYLRWKNASPADQAPVIGIAFHEQYVRSLQTRFLDELIRRIEQAGGIPLAFYFPAMNGDGMEQILAPNGKTVADVVITTRIMLRSNVRRQAMDKLGIPVIQAMTYRRGDVDQWRDDPHGVPLVDVPFYMAQAEYAGVFDIQVASAMGADDGQPIPIQTQLDSVVGKAMRLARLQTLPAADKRVTMFFWNYPMGEKNLSASFLNLPRSLLTTLAAMKEAGYQTRAPSEDKLIEQLQRLLEPYYRQGRLEALVGDGLAVRLPLAEYRAWLGKLPETVRTRLLKEAGDPADSGMLLGEGKHAAFVIPRLKLGNVVLMPQPPRSGRLGDQEAKIYHSTSAAPDHFYLAAYLWARNHSDAFVHFGTHGTQEWLPGKERGLSVHDDPMLAVGEVPVVYPYIADNIGEALQARRRGRAVIISHQTPPFQPAGLHNELNDMHDLLHQWLQQIEGSVRDQLKSDLLDKAVASHVERDMGWTEARAREDFPAFVDALHAHLHVLAQTAQPLGLHRFGTAPDDRHRVATVLLMLGQPFIEAAARHAGVPDDQLDETLVVDYQKLTNSPPFALLHKVLVKGESPGDIQPELAKMLDKARQYHADIGAGSEVPGLLDALSGRHVPTSYGGDPIKNPDAYPTGRNLYPFDPSRVPTRQAWEAGKEAAEKLLAAQREQAGAYPDKLTFSLWSTETMRHQGLLEAQALWLLGVQPVWDDGGRVTDVELVDRKTLGRPRVDVVLSITGLYRDHFPNVIKQLARAVELAARADEADNAVAAHSRAIRQRLQAEGVGEAAARNAGLTRIFSSRSGHYGTGLQDATLASDSWGGQAEGDAKLANLYLSKMQYAYGPDQDHWGQRGVAGKTDLNLYSVHLRGTDGAVLSRTSNTYGMLTTDDPFQYLGGISLAVRHLDGKPPALYISNLRGGGSGKVQSAASFLAQELSTREFHPGYIKAMMEEGYAGTLSVLDSTNNLWGWTAVAREVVRDDQWQTLMDVYVRDKYKLGVNEWFEQANPHAQAQIIERMLEAARKGYWDAAAESVRELKTRYQQLASRFDVQSSNEDFLAYVASGRLAEFAPASAQASESAADASPEPAAPQQKVQGMKLEKVSPAEAAPSEPRPPWIALVMALLVALGGAQQSLRRRPSFLVLDEETP